MTESKPQNEVEGGRQCEKSRDRPEVFSLPDLPPWVPVAPATQTGTTEHRKVRCGRAQSLCSSNQRFQYVCNIHENGPHKCSSSSTPAAASAGPVPKRPKQN
jgi:hypothetical protein